MAKRDEQQRKLELLEQLSRQRAQITSQKSRLATQIEDKKEEIKEKINVPKRLKNNIRSSFSSSPTKWFLGSAVGGLIVTKLLLGKKSRSISKLSSSSSSSTISRGLLTSALLYFGKPMLKRVLFNKAKDYVIGRFHKRQSQAQIEQQQQYYRS